VSRFAFGLLAPAAVSAWSPLSFGSDLLGWWDAQDGATITQSGGTVSQWSDKSGSGNHLVQATGANQPAYDPTGFDGSRPAITSRSLTVWLDNTAFLIGSAAVTFIIAVNIDTDAATGSRLFSLFPPGGNDYSGTGLGLLPLYVAGSGTVGAYFDSVPRATGAASYGTKHWLASEWDGANHQIYTDGAQVGSQPAVTSAFSTTCTLRILNSMLDTEGLYGRVGEALVIKRALTTQDRTDLAAYMARWGL
jgi:hypothetical protein